MVAGGLGSVQSPEKIVVCMSLYDAARIRHSTTKPFCRAAVKGVQFGPGRSEGERVASLMYDVCGQAGHFELIFEVRILGIFY